MHFPGGRLWRLDAGYWMAFISASCFLDPSCIRSSYDSCLQDTLLLSMYKCIARLSTNHKCDHEFTESRIAALHDVWMPGFRGRMGLSYYAGLAYELAQTSTPRSPQLSTSTPPKRPRPKRWLTQQIHSTVHCEFVANYIESA